MKVVINILKSLGLNETVIPQFIIFIITFIFLNYFVFNKYLAAYEERRRRTVDSKDVDGELQSEIDKEEAKYAKEAKDINEQISAVFETRRKEAQAYSQSAMATAHTEQQQKLTTGKQSIEDAVATARAQLKSSVTEIGQLIKQRLLNR